MPLNATEFASTLPTIDENFSLLLDWYWDEFNANWSSSAEVKQSMSKTILVKWRALLSLLPTNTVCVFPPSRHKVPAGLEEQSVVDAWIRHGRLRKRLRLVSSSLCEETRCWGQAPNQMKANCLSLSFWAFSVKKPTYCWAVFFESD